MNWEHFACGLMVGGAILLFMAMGFDPARIGTTSEVVRGVGAAFMLAFAAGLWK